ncbi:unnamed protein product [Ceratitis capitata]|uniref:(Mediterranean fruit fly) hypothetical protein n=1 Tax=Ceratitis capitata TaxID=7213 RepID=A0A811VGU7_CERCA|nr:unnamed protein product [Ceratitis capitata]
MISQNGFCYNYIHTDIFSFSIFMHFIVSIFQRYANSVNNLIITAINDRCAAKLLLSGNTGAYRYRLGNNKPFKISHDNGFLYAFVGRVKSVYVCRCLCVCVCVCVLFGKIVSTHWHFLRVIWLSLSLLLLLLLLLLL